MRIELNARVRTRDGEDVGDVEQVIFDPQERAVLGVVVNTTAFLVGDDVIVPLGHIESASEDGDAIYCVSSDWLSVLRVASDGTRMVLGALVNFSKFVPSNIAFDDRYVYWSDPAPVGTITRVPKSGGAPRIIARDAYPLAVAVDENAVYWSDQGGNLWRLAK